MITLQRFYISIITLVVLASAATSFAQEEESNLPLSPYSIAGQRHLPYQANQRHLADFNAGWKFLKADEPQAIDPQFDDSKWATINLPHGLELLPTEASGCINYQGKAWYRKHFTVPAEIQEGKKVTLYFEGIMGKSTFYLNGKKIKEHLGGFLPIILDVTDELKMGETNVVSILADNSDDKSYPPGKTQNTLDFCYFGGIYRDAYLIATNPIYISDPNAVNKPGGGGVFFSTVSYDPKTKVSTCNASVHLINDTDSDQKVLVNAVLTTPTDTVPASKTDTTTIPAKTDKTISFSLKRESTKPWSPQSPHLYDLIVSVHSATGGTDTPAVLIDAQKMQVGIRTIKLDDKGLTLNGLPYSGKLIGANRHQDFAVIGNAASNNLQWEDARKLKEAGVDIVRCAHYPMDPAFMDACDKLGIFVIITTPGWQFWNNTPSFAECVYEDIRQMVRRDRNHPSAFMWEPILNETHYPNDFAKRAYDIVHEESPGAGVYAASDTSARGAEHYDVLYAHPAVAKNNWAIGSDTAVIPGKAYFTREFGDNVDDWSAQNSPSRVSRGWGEMGMLIQARNYLTPPFSYTSWEYLYRTPIHHFGGTLWHPFDHQRGYHNDPFYGGILDAFRQPKLSYYAFASQRPPAGTRPESGPLVYIANALTPFSPEDVTLYTNCQSVRVTVNNEKPREFPAKQEGLSIPHPPIIIAQAWDVMKGKDLSRTKKGDQVRILAEGLIDGKVVATHQVTPSRRATHLRLSLNTPQVTLQANGSDMVVVIATLVDKEGTAKRLSNASVQFQIEGPAELLADATTRTNPRRIEWGTAPVIVRTTTTPGKIKITAKLVDEGSQTPIGGEIEFTTELARLPAISGITAQNKAPLPDQGKPSPATPNTIPHQEQQQIDQLIKERDSLRQELNDLRQKEVGKQQEEFE